ncbi:MAG: SDR family oxidoreductase [Xenococcaceae cyanobacterium MO_188.B32]|nr:SDR family oxidoreductase [Xenococcaceae cyanobacterium MO_188.B32]
MGSNYYDLTDKTALITGAAGLLGVEHAAALAAVGAKVVLTDINEAALQKAAEKLQNEFDANQILAYNMDVTALTSIKAVQEQLNANGGVDILINNAAIDPKVKQDNSLLETSRFERFPLEQWNFQLNVGLTGAFLCSQVFGTAMAQRGTGVILNIASDLSVIAPDQRLYRRGPEEQQPVKPVTYSVIKTALVGLTRYLATYWAERGVRVNALSPGGIYNNQGEEFVTRLTNLIPMGRMAERDEYRGVVQFLCSDASRYLTGQNIIVDGGRSVW